MEDMAPSEVVGVCPLDGDSDGGLSELHILIAEGGVPVKGTEWEK